MIDDIIADNLIITAASYISIIFFFRSGVITTSAIAIAMCLFEKFAECSRIDAHRLSIMCSESSIKKC
jgi:hypothetical protein